MTARDALFRVLDGLISVIPEDVDEILDELKKLGFEISPIEQSE